MAKKVTHKKFRFYELHPDGGGPKGLVSFKPKMRKQDKRALPSEFYAVVFFPKITGIGKASVDFYGISRTISNSPEAAKSKFMDGIRKGEKWATYAKAGHCVRKLKISDMGDATTV